MTALDVDTDDLPDEPPFGAPPPEPDPSPEMLRRLFELQLAREIIRRFERTHVPPRLLEGLPTPTREQLQASVRDDVDPVSLEEAHEMLEAQGLPDSLHEALDDQIEDTHEAARERAYEVLSGRYDVDCVASWLTGAAGDD